MNTYKLNNGKLSLLKKTNSLVSNNTIINNEDHPIEIISFSVGLYHCTVTRCNGQALKIERSLEY